MASRREEGGAGHSGFNDTDRRAPASVRTSTRRDRDTVLILPGEVKRYGIRVNILGPAAGTRMTVEAPGMREIVAAPADGSFDVYCPADVAPVVVWLLSSSNQFSGPTFFAKGAEVREFVPWHYGRSIDNDAAQWMLADLDKRMAELA